MKCTYSSSPRWSRIPKRVSVLKEWSKHTFHPTSSSLILWWKWPGRCGSAIADLSEKNTWEKDVRTSFPSSPFCVMIPQFPEGCRRTLLQHRLLSLVLLAVASSLYFSCSLLVNRDYTSTRDDHALVEF